MKLRSRHSGGGEDNATAHVHVCPKTGRTLVRRAAFPLIGIASFLWFLVRVLPKPSRAAYPCQQVAAPLAASFVVWISGLLATAFAYRKWRQALSRHRRLLSVVCAAAALAAGVVTVSNMPHPVKAETWPAWHTPVGTAKGIKPGRVAWVWNPGATNWAGYSSSSRWYEDAQTDPIVVERMISQAVRSIAGKNTDAEAWDAIFRYYNQTHGRGDRGYIAGEKIMIKLNMVVTDAQLANVSMSTWDMTNTNTERNKITVAPQMVRGLLKELVYTVGVSQSDITVGDPSAYWPNQYLTQIHDQYPNVVYVQNPYNYTSAPYRTKATFSTTPFLWSTPAAYTRLDYIPTCFTQADYVINFTTLKGHSSGVTLCGKNNYGSLTRLPNGWYNGVSYKTEYYFMHQSLPNNGISGGLPWSPGIRRYRAIVDLMGHPGLGGKTVLYLIDGLYGGYFSDSVPYKWNMAPFGGDWPSSLFASQDPVAIDSVGYDFIKQEWPLIVQYGQLTADPNKDLLGGAEDYLHEAAQAGAPPSGTTYDPDRDGVVMQSQGVHEHWNNSSDKKYSRNLGTGSGIELVTLRYDAGSIQRAKLTQNTIEAPVIGGVVTAAFTDYFYVESDDREFGIRAYKVSHGLTIGQRVNVTGPMRMTTDDERYLEVATGKFSLDGTGSISPMVMTVNQLGGGNWHYSSSDVGQAGVPGSMNINNIGLLVRSGGRITAVDSAPTPTWFRIDDGSGATVKCVVPGGVTIDRAWNYAAVTGISSCEKVGGVLTRLLRVRQQSDISAW